MKNEEIEMNEVEKKDIVIKQNRLRAVLDIGSLCLDDVDDRKKEHIENYVNREKFNLVIDILDALTIREFDMSFYEENGGNGYSIDCTIENTIDGFKSGHLINSPVIEIVFDEFVDCIATYEICDLIDFGVVSAYLKMLAVCDVCYSDIDVSECKKI